LARGRTLPRTFEDGSAAPESRRGEHLLECKAITSNGSPTVTLLCASANGSYSTLAFAAGMEKLRYCPTRAENSLSNGGLFDVVGSQKAPPSRTEVREVDDIWTAPDAFPDARNQVGGCGPARAYGPHSEALETLDHAVLECVRHEDWILVSQEQAARTLKLTADRGVADRIAVAQNGVREGYRSRLCVDIQKSG
jgi:hypothetical protein